MYSRAFQQSGEHLPPHYGGTALRQREHREAEGDCERKEGQCPPPEHERECPQDTHAEEACQPPPPAPHFPLPYGIRLEDLMLLGLAVLLWLDGCEDEYLPLLLLFLLIVH